MRHTCFIGTKPDSTASDLMKDYGIAEAFLESLGYKDVLTLSSSSGDAGHEFGTLYTKGEHEVWLNHKTLPKLLSICKLHD